MLPGCADRLAVVDAHREPRGGTQVSVPGLPVADGERVQPDILAREVRHRVAAGLVQEQHVLVVGDPLAGELHPHRAPQTLDVQQALGQRFGGEEPSH